MLKEDELLLANLRQLSQKALAAGKMLASGFLDPRQQALAQSLGRGEAACPLALYGGYPEAERRLALFCPDGLPPAGIEAYLAEQPQEQPLAVLRLAGRGLKLSHRDYLGALLALGVQRSICGDILVRDDGADLIILQSMADFLFSEYRQVGRYALEPQLLPLAQLALAPAQLVAKRAVVASARADNIAAAVFNLGRAQAVEQIQAGRLLRNGLPCLKPDQTLQDGDTLALRGQGKARLGEIKPSGKKGRLAVNYHWYA